MQFPGWRSMVNHYMLLLHHRQPSTIRPPFNSSNNHPLSAVYPCLFSALPSTNHSSIFINHQLQPSPHNPSPFNLSPIISLPITSPPAIPTPSGHPPKTKYLPPPTNPHHHLSHQLTSTRNHTSTNRLPSTNCTPPPQLSPPSHTNRCPISSP
jgi:hypothetical protein